jgi:rod shape-determining protein MreD
MRWFPFLLLAYIVVAVQLALRAALGWGAWTPNLVFLVVMFVGMHALLEPAMIAGLLLGLMHDVIASHGIGTYALGYTVVAAIAVQLRGVMYSDHFVTHIMMPFGLGFALLMYLLFRQWVRNLYYPFDHPEMFGAGMASLVITSALAVPMIRTLRYFRRTFAFEK